MRLRLLLVAIGVLFLAGASHAAGPPPWFVTYTGGLNYKVTFTNPDASHVNAIGVANANHTGDPITAMSATGWTCNPYAPTGSYICSGDVAPTQKVVFLVTVQTALDPSVAWLGCYSIDGGAHVTCKDDIPAITPPPAGVKSAYHHVLEARRLEKKALKDKWDSQIRRELEKSLNHLKDAKAALAEAGGEAGSEVAPVTAAIKKDETALHDVRRGHLNVPAADAQIKAAIKKKE
jgi:hypothetical protein